MLVDSYLQKFKASKRSDLQLFCDSIWEKLKEKKIEIRYPLLLGMARNKGKQAIFEASEELVKYRPENPESYFKAILGKQKIMLK